MPRPRLNILGKNIIEVIILSYHIRRYVMSACMAIGKAIGLISLWRISLVHFILYICMYVCKMYICILYFTFACLSNIKNAIILYQFFCRFSPHIFMKFIHVSSSSFIFHCHIILHYINAFAYSPTDGYRGYFYIFVYYKYLLYSFLYIFPCTYYFKFCTDWVERYTQPQNY